MKKIFVIITFTFFTIFISCGDVGSSYGQITTSKTTLQRIKALNKTMAEIKGFEDIDALVIEDTYYLEYEYPIREDESYVMSYRFDNSGCFEIGFDIYFNKQYDARNVSNGMIKELDSNFNLIAKDNNCYRWENLANSISIELDINHIERGMISLTVFSLE